MALNILKRDIASGGDVADFGASLERYSLTDRAPVVVANMTEANQVASQLVSTGAGQAFPLFCFVQDAQRHVCLPASNQSWIILGGRLHGAQVKVDRNAPDSVTTELHVVSFERQSVGFIRDASSGGIKIPESGLYRIRLGGNIEGITASTPGRRLFSLRVNGQNIGGNVSFEGDTSAKVFDEWVFEQGDVLMPVVYHATGSSRLVKATMGVYQSLTPSW